MTHSDWLKRGGDKGSLEMSNVRKDLSAKGPSLDVADPQEDDTETDTNISSAHDQGWL